MSTIMTNSMTNTQKNFIQSQKEKFYPELVKKNDDSQIELTNETRLLNLQKLHDERLSSLYNNIKNIASRFDNDDLLNTMRKDETSIVFINQRLKEIVDENLISEHKLMVKRLQQEIYDTQGMVIEREKIIQQLKEYIDNEIKKSNHQENITISLQNDKLYYENELVRLNQEYNENLNQLNIHLNNIGNENKRLRDNLKDFEENNKFLEEKNENLKKDNAKYIEEFERLSKVILVQEIKINSSDNEILERENKIKELQEEISKFNNRLNEISSKYENNLEEKNSQLNLIKQKDNEINLLKETKSVIHNELNQEISKIKTSLENEYKEKSNKFKRKILEQKKIIENYEELALNDKKLNETLKTEIYRSNIKFQEDLLIVKNQWEDQMKLQENHYEKIIYDLENKISEINMINKRNLNEFEDNYLNEANKSLTLYKIQFQEKENEIKKLNELNDALNIKLKNEYVSKKHHDEMLKEEKENLMKKTSINEEELNKNFKTKLKNIEEELKSYYQNQIEIMKKSSKRIEESLDSSLAKSKNLDEELKKEKESNIKKIEELEKSKKYSLYLKSQCDDFEKFNNSLINQLGNMEKDLNSYIETNNNLKEELSFLNDKISEINKEKNYLIQKNSDLEVHFESERDEYKKEIQEIRNLYENEIRENKQIKKYIEEVEKEKNVLSQNYQDLEFKNNENVNKIVIFEELVENINGKLKISEADNENYQRDLNDQIRINKRLIEERKIQGTKINEIMKKYANEFKKEITIIKSNSLNEIMNIKKEYSSKFNDAYFLKLKFVRIDFEKELDKSISKVKETMNSEFELKIKTKEENFQEQVTIFKSKSEHKLNELKKSLEKKEFELKELIDEIQSLRLKNNEISIQKHEIEKELTKSKAELSILSVDFGDLQKKFANLNDDKIYLLKIKEEQDEQNDKNIIDIKSHYQNHLLAIQNGINDLKMKYLNKIAEVKSNIQIMVNQMESENNERLNHNKRTIEHYENLLDESNETIRKLLISRDQNLSENQTFKQDLDKLSQIYENKIEFLNSKINHQQEKIKELKTEIKSKSSILNEVGNENSNVKNQSSILKSQLKIKNEEISYLKKEFERIIDLKDKKIIEFQNLISQSYSSFNTGINNIKFANQLDVDVKNLIKNVNSKQEDLDNFKSTSK